MRINLKIIPNIQNPSYCEKDDEAKTLFSRGKGTQFGTRLDLYVNLTILHRE